ncbi:Mediator of RNA polymerase II transcription subunit 6 [Thelohanellus kitauei]|uniref:Mediator of RNA polymerase II transcription subunit 6 n=1 Tax=Thelohanellus kitauei TaxID=669202 RepID=A0A0C2M8S8_THEKT|nr:Mediator of RNA polymerase II transcription subunit 6 [Thelohanellus kitauei]
MDNPSVSCSLSWRDESFLPNLNATTALYYFCQLSNPFYDRTSNNEIAKMQRLDYSQLSTMVGLEYELLVAQEPFLYVICKQMRTSPTTATPITYYYIISGTAYQCPDVYMLIRNKLTSALYCLNQGFCKAEEYIKLKESMKKNLIQQKQDDPGSVAASMGNIINSTVKEFSDQ